MPWQVPDMWKNGECWIIGGGPSLPRQFGVPEDVIQRVLSGEGHPKDYSPYFSAIHDKHCIGVNMAFHIGDWIDIVFFGDSRFYLSNKRELAKFPGLKITSNTRLARIHTAKEEYVKIMARNTNHPDGISMKPGYVSWNKNSGAAAISIAAQAGVTRIILLGFDMSLGKDDKQHWHPFYSTNNKSKRPAKLPFDRHLQGFPLIKEDADRLGIEIINASPDSKIEVFKKVALKDLLCG